MSTASSNRIPLLVLLGPTASGKTELLAELFASKPGGTPEAEVISADSMQAYRGMDIGTAKPGPELLARLPHHLIDIREPSEQYNVGDFVHLADEAATEIWARGRLPVLAGGAGFYVRNFVLGLPSCPPSAPELRAGLLKELAEGGREALRAELLARDPVAAARIHINDDYRLIRSLEITRATHSPLSRFAPSKTPRSRYDFLLVELTRPREQIHARIDSRVDEMFVAGLPEEFETLRAKGFGPEAPAMKAIGYREFFDIVPAAGAGPEVPPTASKLLTQAWLAAVRELIKGDTRRYAKRQETYFRGLPGLTRLEGGPQAVRELAILVEGLLSRHPRG